MPSSSPVCGKRPRPGSPRPARRIAEGWTAFEIKAESVRLACYRGDAETAAALVESLARLRAARRAGGIAGSGPRGARPDQPAPQVAAMQGDTATVRELLAPVWQIPDLESQTDCVWRAVLLAAGAEADNARRLQGRSRRTDLSAKADEHVARLRDVAARLHAVGPLGVAWTQHLTGELLRYEGLDTAEVWQGAEEAWATVGVPARPGLGAAAPRGVPPPRRRS